MRLKLAALALGLFNLLCSPLVAGSLQISLSPAEAVSAGAQWRVDGGVWQSSGATVTSLAAGNHTVDYKTVAGYTNPASETVSLAAEDQPSLARSYTVTTGLAAQLTVTLAPSATAKWRIDGGAWRNSGNTATGLLSGAHTLEYSVVANHASPPTETFTLVAGSNSLHRAYTELAQVTVALTPSTAKWRLDGGTWRNSQAYATNLAPGAHTIEYSFVSGYATPPTETVTLAVGTNSLQRSYTQYAQLTVTLTPSTAKWRLDGGTWRNSGYTLYNLSLGGHLIEYSDPAGTTALPAETVTLASGPLTLTRTLDPAGQSAQVTVALSPASGQWRIDSGAWQASGAALAHLATGSHTIEYNTLAGYSTPASETITLAVAQSLSLSRSYTVQAAQLTVTLTPATGQWRVDGGIWQANGATVTGLAAGDHQVEYGSLAGHNSPPTETITLIAGQAALLARTYAPLLYTAASTGVPGVYDYTGANAGGAHAINLEGAVTGGTFLHGQALGYIYADGVVEETGNLGGPGVALALNDRRVAVGFSWTSPPSDARHATRYENGWLQSIDAGGTAFGVNFDGAVVGQSGAGSAFLHVDGAMFDLGKWGGQSAAALDINDSDVIVGVANTSSSISQAVRYHDGQLEVIPGLGGTANRANAINNAGVIVGDGSLSGSSPRHAFRRDNGVTMDLGTLGGANSRALDLNDAGVIVGWAEVAADTPHAFVYREGTLLDLNGLVSLPPGVVLTAATGINASGQIIANGSDALGYILTPVTNLGGVSVQLANGTGQWRINGGAWQNSNAVASGLAAGSHPIEYATVAGYNAPSSETVTINGGRTAVVRRNYTAPPGQLTITLTPASGEWRVDGGAWLASGATATGLAAGSHSVDYLPLVAYTAPATESITLAAGQSLAVTRTYAVVSGQIWTGAGANANWNTAANWSTNVIPATGNAVSLGANARTVNTLNYTISLASLTYVTNASAFTTTVSGLNVLTLTGTGVSNLSGQTQTLVLPGNPNAGTAGNGASLALRNSATAGSLAIICQPSLANDTHGGLLSLDNSSTLGNAQVTLQGGTAFNRWGGWAFFNGASSAGASTIHCQGGAGGLGGVAFFTGGATAGNATLLNDRGSVEFWGNSTAGSATLNANSGEAQFWDTAKGGNAVINALTSAAGMYGTVRFSNTSTAESATITASGAATTGQNKSGRVYFDNFASAGAATLYINGGTVNGAGGAVLEFATSSTAGNATITIGSGTNGGTGGIGYFFGNATGGNAAFIVNAGGSLHFETGVATSLSAGSLAGDGDFFLAGKTLTVGSANTNTLVTGTLAGTGGRLVKTGTGELALSGANTYTGGTIVNAGTLRASNATGSALGTGTVTVATGATLAGTGSFTGALTLNGILAPGTSPGTLSTGSQTWNGGGSYLWEINNAAGTTGTNWDSTNITGTLTLAATPVSRFTLSLRSLTAGNAAGQVPNFSPTANYSFNLATASSGITGFNAAAFTIDTGGFANAFTGTWSVAQVGNALNLVYTPPPTTGQLTVTLSPASGQWRVDGGAWQASGATVTGLTAGDHAVEYITLSGYTAPATETVSLLAGQSHSLARSYTAQPAQLTITLTPASGQWRVDGGVWRNSDTTATGLAAGNHTIEYNGLSGYTAPATESILLSPAQSLSLSRSYTGPATQLTVNLVPASGRWRLDTDSTWRNSGATISGTPPGDLTIYFEPLAGYTPPINEQVNVPAGAPVSITRTHLANAAPVYTAVELPVVTRGQPGGINNAGHVAVSARIADGHTRAHLGVDGLFTDLGAPGGGDSFTTGLNERGTVVGWWWDTPSSNSHAFIYRNGAMVDLSAVATSRSQASDVNESDHVAGWYTNPAGQYHAFFWDGGSLQDLGTLGGNQSIAWALNDTGVIVGGASIPSGANQAFAWANGVMANLGTLGGTNSRATDINNAGVIVGGADVAGGLEHAFLWANGSMQDLGLLGGVDTSLAYAINESGVVVGSAQKAAFTPSLRAFVTRNGALTDLNSLVSVPGVVLTWAVRINDQGEILVVGTDFVTSRLFVLTPVTQPAQLTVTLSPVSGQWRIDGGAWQASGTTVTGLTAGSHTVEYDNLAGYMTPASETVTLSSGQSLSLNRSYTPASAQLSVTLTPSVGQWRLTTETTWRAGGTTVTLPPGTHSIYYAPVTGCNAPINDTITLSPGQSLTLSRSYTLLAAPPSYTAVEISSPDGNWNTANAINNNSVVAGQKHISGADFRAYRHDSGGMQDLGTLGGTSSAAYGINLAGTVVGQAQTPAGHAHAFVTNSGSLQDLGTLGGNYSSATDISDTGWIVGTSSLASGRYHAFRHDGTSMVDLGTLGGDNSFSQGINQANVIVGASDTAAGDSHAFVLTAGVMQDLGTFGGSWSTAFDINNAGIVVGGAEIVPGTPHAFVSNGGALQDLGTLGTQTSSVALAINNAGTVVGYAFTNQQVDQRPFVMVDGIMTDINTLVNIPGVLLTQARDINDLGQIVVYGTNFVTDISFILTPVSAPPASLQVDLVPATGQWRVDDGAWQASGTTVTGLTAGSHTVEYDNLTGYMTPASETVTLSADQSLSLNRSYAPVTEQLYTVITLPSEGIATAINASGDVVGEHTNPQGAHHAYRYSNGVLYDLGAFESDYSRALAINDAGIVVGSSLVGTTEYTMRAFRHANGTMQDLGTLGNASGHSLARGINSAGTIVGISVGADGTGQHAILLADGALVDLGTFGGSQAAAMDINDSDVVVGTISMPDSSIRAFQYSAGAAQVLPGLGGTNNHAYAINNTGIVVGEGSLPGSMTPRATRHENGTVQDLGTLGGASSRALAINNAGIIVGMADVTGGSSHAFIYSNGVMVDLNSVVNLPGIVLTEAVGINDNGQIVANDSASHSHILTPIATVGSMQVNLTPATGQWRVDGGAWQASGATVASLAAGNHTVEYSSLSGYTTPASETVTLASGQTMSLARSYNALGSVRTYMMPSAESRWRLDGGEWLISGADTINVSLGSHLVEFMDISGYITPAAQTITVSSGQITDVYASYTALGSVRTYMMPSAESRWRLDGGEWLSSGTDTIHVSLGSHLVEFMDIPGYTTPAPQTVTVTSGQVTEVYASYEQSTNVAQLSVSLIPTRGQWRLDGGEWHDHGAYVTNLPLGDHTIEYRALPNYTSPPTETVTLANGQSTYLDRAYQLVPSVQYSVTDLGNLGGPGNTNATALNLAGMVSGTSHIAGGPARAFLYRDGAMQNLGTFGSDLYSFGYGLNDDGEAVGISFSTADTSHPFVYRNGAMQDLGSLGGPTGTGYDISNTGFVVGRSQASPTQSYAFIHDGTSMVSLGSLGGTDHIAYAINEGGTIVGAAYVGASYHAFRWRNGTMEDVNPLLNTSTSYAYDVNEAGTIAGIRISGGDYRAFSLTNDGVMQDLGRLGATYTYARAINGAGHVVGNSSTDNGNHAFLHRGAGIEDLNHLVNLSDVVLEFAEDINDLGQIATNGSDGHAYLLTPINAPGGLQLDLTPASGQWRVDGGAWQTSGSPVLGLVIGNHTVEYGPLAGYSAPAPETVTIASGRLLQLSRSYTAVPQTAQVTITLTPTTAQWRIDGGAWQASGATVTGLNAGSHTVDYNTVAGYTGPATETVNLAAGDQLSLTRSYTVTAGLAAQLTVTLAPSATAKWRIDGGAWRNSGNTATGLLSGTHTLEYSVVANHASPPTETVTLVAGSNSLHRAYTELAQVTVALTPSTAKWRLDGGTWRNSQAYASNLTPGTHTIEYSFVSGYATPPTETVTLAVGTNSLQRSYTQYAQLTVTLNPSTAKWRLDGGTWRNSGSVATNLTPGAHSVEYGSVSGYATPPAETVTLAAGSNTIQRSY